MPVPGPYVASSRSNKNTFCCTGTSPVLQLRIAISSNKLCDTCPGSHGLTWRLASLLRDPLSRLGEVEVKCTLAEINVCSESVEVALKAQIGNQILEKHEKKAILDYY